MIIADIDECTENASICDLNANCTDIDGSFTCTCKTGYTGDGDTCESMFLCPLICDNSSFFRLLQMNALFCLTY